MLLGSLLCHFWLVVVSKSVKATAAGWSCTIVGTGALLLTGSPDRVVRALLQFCSL